MAVATDSAGVALGTGVREAEGTDEAPGLEAGDVTQPKNKNPKTSRKKERFMTSLPFKTI